MSTTPQPARSNRRLAVVLAVLVVAALIVIGLVAAYMFFFGSEAPAAPTLDDALKVLLPSATPENSG
jgi:Kef-type K+ transport system membrane component KefB